MQDIIFHVDTRLGSKPLASDEPCYACEGNDRFGLEHRAHRGARGVMEKKISKKIFFFLSIFLMPATYFATVTIQNLKNRKKFFFNFDKVLTHCQLKRGELASTGEITQVNAPHASLTQTRRTRSPSGRPLYDIAWRDHSIKIKLCSKS